MVSGLPRKLIVGITGASGILYALRLLDHCELLSECYREVFVIYTEAAEKVAKLEEGIVLVDELDKKKCVSSIYSGEELSAPLSSSSFIVGSDMVIVPASLNTIAKLAHGIQDNLLLRAALSVLRVKGRLVIVPRETPLSTIDLENLLKLSLNGAVILPASPGFYIRPREVTELVDFIVGKILDVLGIENRLYKRWGGGERIT